MKFKSYCRGVLKLTLNERANVKRVLTHRRQAKAQASLCISEWSLASHCCSQICNRDHVETSGENHVGRPNKGPHMLIWRTPNRKTKGPSFMSPIIFENKLRITATVLRRWYRCYSYSLLLCGLFYEAICCMSFRVSFCSCVFQSF